MTSQLGNDKRRIYGVLLIAGPFSMHRFVLATGISQAIQKIKEIMTAQPELFKACTVMQSDSWTIESVFLAPYSLSRAKAVSALEDASLLLKNKQGTKNL